MKHTGQIMCMLLKIGKYKNYFCKLALVAYAIYVYLYKNIVRDHFSKNLKSINYDGIHLMYQYNKSNACVRMYDAYSYQNLTVH